MNNSGMNNFTGMNNFGMNNSGDGTSSIFIDKKVTDRIP